MRYPPINDITTTPDAAPMFHSGPAAGKKFPPRFAKAHAKHYADLVPLHSEHTVSELIERTARHAESHKWQVLTHDSEQGRFQAVAITRLMRFRDDIVVQIEDTGSERIVHVRSRSRLGKGDLGANYQRIRALLLALQS